MTTSLNLFSWSETSNLLFLTQPVGVGFSYTINGTVPETSRLAAETVWQAVQAFLTDLPRISQRVKTRDFNLWTERCLIPFPWPCCNSRALTVSQLRRTLWTRSDPPLGRPQRQYADPTQAFLRHFYVENELIKRGLKEGVSLNLKTLGVGNGIIDGALQFPQASTARGGVPSRPRC
jgi:carboxypeptidase D